MACVEVKRQFGELPLSSQCGSWELNSSHQVCQASFFFFLNPELSFQACSHPFNTSNSHRQHIFDLILIRGTLQEGATIC